MDFHYEIKNEKLKEPVEKKAQILGISTDELIWAYINRGLMNYGISEEAFNNLHSKKHLLEINNALGID